MRSLGRDVFVVGAKRTPFGSFGGSLRDVSATDLAVMASRAALAQAGIEPTVIEQVIFGNVLHSSADTCYLARHVGLRSGVPVAAPALSVNRLCGGGFQAVISGAEQIVLGDAEVCLVGGTENMSLTPHVVRGARWGLSFPKHAVFEDSLWASLHDTVAGMPMAMTAETLAKEYRITRDQANEYAHRSQMAWQRAHAAGVFKSEVVAVEVKARHGTYVLEVDEHPRAHTTLDGLAKLPPVFTADGVVTAGNASGVSDGAAAMVLASVDAVKRHGLKPLARVVQWGIAGCEPRVMGIGPVPAMRRALDRAGLALDAMDVVEVNEAFAAQYLAVERDLGLDRERTNANGGAIAVGHPLGASGARITGHLCYELARREKRYAIGSACIGGGQGIAVILERA